MENYENEERVLGRVLSIEEMEQVSGGVTTPKTDGCADEQGNDVECPAMLP
ncbi:hypothetical protein [Thalassotalea euphylliae]|uniref:hypothetical protein n=1 Tax=Thalassotalea euphylliae TaxID=1655234 RepID=UPI0015F28C88|nr:hypothetical protein [Thalassotalea euphylliae]